MATAIMNTTTGIVYVRGISGSLTITSGQILGSDGTAAAPTYSFTSQPGLGLYYRSSNFIGIMSPGYSVSNTVASFGSTGLYLGSTALVNWSSSGDSAGTTDLIIGREAANHFFQRNSTNAQRASWANTYTSSTNYESFSVDWQTQANNAIVGTRTVATGNGRVVMFASQATNAGDGYAGYRAHSQAATPLAIGWYSSAGVKQTFTGFTTLVSIGEGTNTATSGTFVNTAILPTYNQASGTAANTDLLINRTETAIGSGNQYLIQAQVGGTDKCTIDRSGNVVATGNVTSQSVIQGANTSATPAGGSTSVALKVGSAGVGHYIGTGAPSVSAPKGSIYVRTDATTTTTRMYINTDGGTTWTNFTTAA